MKRRIVACGALILACVIGTLMGCTSWFAPSIDFVVSTVEGPEPLVVEFTPVSEKSIASCSWTFGDGETSDRISPVHVYRAPGAYTVRLVAELIDGAVVAVEKLDLVRVTVPQRKGTPQYVYWIDWWNGGIWRGPRAGGQAERIVAEGSHSFRALTVADGWIYWADNTDATIRRAELDGAHVETLFRNQHFVSDLEVVPEGNAIFWVAHPGQIYEWGDYDGGIRFAFFGDSEPQILLSYKPGAERYADQIEVDLAGNRLYWTIEQYDNTWLSGASAPNSTDCSESIRVTGFSGFNPESLRSGLCDVRGLALDSLAGYEAEYVYWADGWAGYIRRCRPDGTGQENLVRKDFWTPDLIAVDRLEGKLYWSDSDGLHRANLDGSERETIYPDLIVSAIALPE